MSAGDRLAELHRKLDALERELAPVDTQAADPAPDPLARLRAEIAEIHALHERLVAAYERAIAAAEDSAGPPSA